MKKLLLPSVILIFSLSAHSQGLWQANGSNIVHTSRLVGINTSNPSQQLEVNGSIKMTDGNQGAGKLFTSDAGGVGSWQTPIWIIDNNIIVNNYDTRDMQVFGTFMPLGFPNIAGN